MGDGYYPKYYQKKKHRDQIFLNIWRVVLVVGLGIAFGTVAFSVFPMARNSNGVADLAEEKEKLENARDSDQASQVKEMPVEGKDVDPPAAGASLEDIRYVPSQPSVHIAIQGVTPDESRDPHEITDVSETGSQNPVNPSGETGVPDSTSTDTSAPSSDGLTRGDPKPETVKEPVESGTQSGSNNSDKKDDNSPPASSANNDKPKPAEKPKEDPPASAQPPKGTTVFLVFAGYYDTRDEAVSRKKDLSTLGFSGTVQEGAGTYSILVSKFEDTDLAKAFEARLEKNGFPDAFVVRAKN